MLRTIKCVSVILVALSLVWGDGTAYADGRDRVMNAIGNLLAAIITTPLADEVVRTTDTTDQIERSRSPIDVREWSSDAHSVKEKLIFPDQLFICLKCFQDSILYDGIPQAGFKEGELFLNQILHNKVRHLGKDK